MRKLTMLALSFSLVAATVTVKAQTLDEVVNKHIDALGGADKLKAIKSLATEGNMSIQGMSFPFKTWTLNTTAMRIDFDAMGTTNTQVLTANGGWSLMPVQQQTEPVDTDPAIAKESANDLDLTGDLFDYKAKGHTAELIGKETVDSKEMYKIKLTRKNGSVTNILLDASTYQIAKRISPKNIQGQEIEITEVFSDYKKTADGYTYPATTEQMPMGMKLSYGKFDYNTAIDQKVFEKPVKK